MECDSFMNLYPFSWLIKRLVDRFVKLPEHAAITTGMIFHLLFVGAYINSCARIQSISLCTFFTFNWIIARLCVTLFEGLSMLLKRLKSLCDANTQPSFLYAVMLVIYSYI